MLSNANADGYTCDSKTYVECNEGYYLSDCGTTYDGRTISSPSAGNSCNSCSTAGDNYECAGGTKCPKLKGVYVTYNMNGGNGSLEKKICIIDASCTLHDGDTTDFYRAGYVFKGWSTSSTSTTGNTTITISVDTTVYAVWEACGTGQYKASSAKANAACSKCAAGTYQSSTGQSSCKECAAGTYQGDTGQSSCKDCETREKFSSSTKSTSCSSVSAGYYTTGCDSSGDKCTGQTQCTGATYCSGGVQYNCPAQTDGWTRKTGNGWTQVSQCNQTKEATSISSCCSAGQLKQSGNDQGKWDTAEVSVDFEAAAGSYVSGTGASTTCAQCEKGYYSAGGKITSCTACGKGKYQDETGQSTCKDCEAIGEGFNSWESSSGLTDDTCPFTCNDDYTPSERTCAQCSKTQACSGGYSGTYDSCAGQTQDTKDKCYIECKAGTYVAKAGETCTSVAENSKKFIGGHTVYWNNVSKLLDCPDGADGSDANAGSAKGCYKNCAAKTIDNGTAKLASGHVYYLSQDKGYADNQCKYSVNCDPSYGAQNAKGVNTHNTNNPMCTLCATGYYSPGGNKQCTSCTNAPKTHATYTSNSTGNNCSWQCDAGYYRVKKTSVSTSTGTTTTTYSCPECPYGSTAVPVTSTPGANDSVRGCYISSIKANNDPVRVTDSTGTFEYRILDKDGNFNPCYHK
ncbi:MAG: InlB B-repeat-containing protein [Alphaproteobacteria bacterium]|nr:InlB B-repeat-containing protein [Alphaproteobacteria bacterium]